ncbi:VanW family protein [Bacillus sp. CECT 9360]|uniref:VanW family protein n=1 Tax=Bacillus sp. CECT 9360 TaxID=2845821 RepID=UPI001E36D5D8|nr:VanW family protein [Bacillus sp. CECT 9360]CAH0347109.1 hypothetical protein BCI9360_03482 [Bacillus sp. CECT 9360]
MRLTSFVVLLLFAQQVHIPDSLSINENGQTIADVNRAEIAVPMPGVPMIHIEKYNELVEKLKRQIYQAPKNAQIDDHGRIVPGRTGIKLYQEEFEKQFYTYFFDNGPNTIEVPKLTIHPKVDSELLANIRIQRIGHYVTFFNANNKERSQNISLAIEAINNHVIFPGETFSFNKVVGNRTSGKGYLRAPIIIKGELSEGIGGGICQVSSTLFNAIDRAGLQIVERYSHSRRVPYVPNGRDATVSWYGPDFRFKNEYNQPILIQAKKQGGSVSILIYSSDAINVVKRKISS